MFELKLILDILVSHWLADFVCQSDHMAINKSKSNKVLALHCLVYTVVVTLLLLPFLPLTSAIAVFALITFALHFCTDYVTSRITSWLWKNEQRHYFFVVIGFDQLLHYFALFGTFYLLFVQS